MIKKLYNYFSLKPLKVKFVFPLILFCSFCICCILIFSRNYYLKQLQENALVRAEHLSHSIGTCAQIVHYPYELQRLIYAFGSERHVRMVAVLQGEPLRLVACNRNSLVNQLWRQYPLPRGVQLPNYPEEQEHFTFQMERGIFTYTTCFEILQRSDKKNIKPIQTYVVVQLDTTYYQKRSIQQSFIVFIIAIIILIVLSSICFFQINSFILKPLQAIKRQINRRRNGNNEAMVPVIYHDEIGDLAITLNEMIRTQANAENLYQKLVDIAPVLIWTTDRNNSVFYFNKRWQEFTGQQNLICNGWTWINKCFRNSAENYKNNFLQAQHFFKSVVFECCIYDRSGHEHWMLNHSAPRILAGTFEGYISCLVDISERKENEKRLASYAKELSKARDIAVASMKAKSDFLATMSHEIRTPINGILGFSYLLKETQLNAEQIDYVNTIISSTQLLLDLINQILDLSKIEANKLTLELIDFSLSECINDTCKLFHPVLLKKHLKLSTWLHPKLEDSLFGDPKRLRQILINLVGNAVKFTDQGQISIRVTGKLLKEKQYLLFISVKDQGCGIPPQEIERIFGAFEQIAYQNKGGTGLGLSISRSLIKLMGGQLKVHSEVNKGSIFYFTTLLKIGSTKFLTEKQEEKILSFPNIVKNNVTVLIADDNIENRRLLQKILEKYGYSILSAETGVECLKCLQNNAVDIILMDINMPGMDGFETTHRIRSGECGIEKAAIPIIGFTARTVNEIYDQAFQIGMNEVLSKPLHPNMLVDNLKKFCSKK